MNITDKIQTTNEDNMVLMARYPDKYFDLAIVDLEYCIGASKPSDKSGFVTQRTSNEYYKLTKLTDEQMLSLSDEVFKETVDNY